MTPARVVEVIAWEGGAPLLQYPDQPPFRYVRERLILRRQHSQCSLTRYARRCEADQLRVSAYGECGDNNEWQVWGRKADWRQSRIIACKMDRQPGEYLGLTKADQTQRGSWRSQLT